VEFNHLNEWENFSWCTDAVARSGAWDMLSAVARPKIPAGVDGRNGNYGKKE
jgi:hypothetical protein